MRWMICILVLLPSIASAYTVSVRQQGYITNTVHVAGGAYASPYVAATPNTEYILDGDIVADGTAISISTSKVIINLNGHTITYNQTTPGCGVASSGYNYADVAIVNGSIIQGAAMSTGVLYGSGSNTIRFHSGTPASYNVARVQIAGIYARYGSQDVGGFDLGGNGHLVEENTVEDTYEFGTLANRHSGITAIKFWGSGNIARSNTIVNARHRGIDAGSGDEIYNNTIGIRSICTNSYGVFAEGSGTKIYNNTITGRGEHPIGIGAHNSTVGASANIEVYGNIIDTQVTSLGTEYSGGVYPSDPLATISAGDNAVGIRSTSGTINLLVHDNTITVHSDSDFIGTWSPDGRPVRMSGGARGIMAGVRYNTQSARFYNNTITATDEDGTGYAAGIACDSNMDNNNYYAFRPPAADFSPTLVFENNTVTSNVLNIAVGDAYGPCSGHPLFKQNILVKSDSYPVYATIGSGISGYYEGTGRFISNTYQGGASENSLGVYFQAVSNNVPNVGGSYRNKSIIFGRVMDAVVKDTGGNLLPNVRLRTYDQTSTQEYETITSGAGGAQLIVYDVRLHNNGGTTNSPTPITVTYRPHTVNLYNLATSATLWTTAAGEWDQSSSSGTYTLTDAAGSIEITPTMGGSIQDITAPITTASPAAGTYTGTQAVTLTINEAGTAYYTIDGTTPTTSSAVYTGPITVATSTVLKWFSRDTAGNQEAVKSATYTIQPAPQSVSYGRLEAARFEGTFK